MKSKLYIEKLKKRGLLTTYPISILTLTFFGLSLFMNIYLLVKYSSPLLYQPRLETFLVQNKMLLVFSISGFLLYLTINRFKLKIDNSKITDSIQKSVFTIFAITISQIIVIKLTKAAISPFDVMVFYAASAISEEFLFRLGLQISIEIVLKKIMKNDHLAGILSVLIVSLPFGLYHWYVKHGAIDLVMAVIITGLILGLVLHYYKNIDICLLSHFFINVMAAYYLTR